MDNEQFVARLNRILAEKHLELPPLDADSAGSSDVVAAWASFLRECVKAGIHLADPRWGRLSIVRQGPASEFVLDVGDPDQPDDDFKVGLQLLMGMLGGGDVR